ncbi:hypothetical protein CB1_000609008 [Camelus ferus]|nr:hypothetical protein CB1_000609008 [Camelus ferus]
MGPPSPMLPPVASSIVSLYFLELTDLFKPAKVGFQCYDRTLSMPYVETSEELIPLLMLLSLAFAAPAASIMVGEGTLYCLQSRLWGRSGGPGGAEGSIHAGGCNFNSFLRRTVRFVGVHVFGLCATALVTDVIQLATGYHAPFFLTVCKPNYTLLGTSCEANPYITQDICSGHDTHAILSARKTFPSQHATLSAFAAVYVSVQDVRKPQPRPHEHTSGQDNNLNYMKTRSELLSDLITSPPYPKLNLSPKTSRGPPATSGTVAGAPPQRRLQASAD